MRRPRIAVASAAATTGWVKVLSLLLTVGYAAQLSAEPTSLTLYRSEAEFLANAPIESTVNFDARPTETDIKHWSFTLEDVVYEHSDGRDAFCWYVGYDNCWFITEQLSDGPPPPTLPHMLGSNALGPIDGGFEGHDIIGLGKNRSATAVGFFFISFVSFEFISEHSPEFTGWEIVVHEVGDTATVFDLPPETAMEPAYYGFVSEVGISRIETGNKPDQFVGFNYGYDNVSRSTVDLLSQETGEQITVYVHPKEIKPGSPNLIEVNVMSDDLFNALGMSMPGVFFGPGEAPLLRYQAQDIDGDGRKDARLWFRVSNTGIRCGDTQATLTGRDLSWNPLYGTDWISTVRCE